MTGSELAFWLFALASIVLPLWGIVDATVRSDVAWDAVGQRRAVWLIVQLLTGPFGALVYLAAIRPKLRSVYAKAGA